MVLSALKVHSLGPISSRPHPGAVLAAETGAAASLVYNFFTDSSLSATQRRFLLDHLCVPKGAEIFLNDNACRLRLEAALSDRVSGDVPIRVTAVAAEVESLGVVSRALYMSFLGALIQSMTPVQAMVLSLIYGIGAFQSSPTGVQTIDDRCFNMQETARLLLISHQRVSQIECDIAKKTHSVLSGKTHRHYSKPKKVSVDFSLELSPDAQESDLKERLKYLQEKISPVVYRKIEAAIYCVLSRSAQSQFKISRQSAAPLTNYSLIVRSAGKEVEFPPDFLIFCERTFLEIEVSRQSVLRQQLMKLYLSLLNAACFEVSRYGELRYASHAIQTLQDFVKAT